MSAKKTASHSEPTVEADDFTVVPDDPEEALELYTSTEAGQQWLAEEGDRNAEAEAQAKESTEAAEAEQVEAQERREAARASRQEAEQHTAAQQEQPQQEPTLS
jgi:hypothetical protein